MSSFRIRPRFKHQIELPVDDVHERIMAAVENTDDVHAEGFVMGHLHVRVPTADQHFWSPQLHLSTEEVEEGTMIRGLYGPNPTVWGLFFFGYVSVGILFFFTGFWGLSRWSLDQPATVLWLLPVLGAVAVGLYLMAQFGQKIGAEQMFRLHHFYEGIFDNKVKLV